MSKATLLIIEDDADNLELVRLLLAQADFQVLSAMDGRTGLDLIHLHHPDLVLLDLSIPEIDGWSLAAQLKAEPETAHIKVVALTAHTLPGDRKKALESGCDGYITKPLNVPTFAREVEDFLSK